MTATQKKKIRRRNFLVILYILAAIGGWTVSVNMFEVTKSAYQHGKSWVQSISFKVPTVVNNNSNQ